MHGLSLVAQRGKTTHFHTPTHPLLKWPWSVSTAIHARNRIPYSINPVDSATSKAVSYEILGIDATCPEYTLTLVHLNRFNNVP